MKILLIYPYFLEQRIHVEEISAVPMGLYYVGAMLKAHGYEVEILNGYDAGHSLAQIKQILIAQKPDLIGFSILHANRWGGIDIARLSKTVNPRIPVVFGGIGATFLSEHLLTHFNEIDYVVLGEGEYTFLALVQAVEQGASSAALADIPGLAWRTTRGIVHNAAAEPIEDLDALPPPARYFNFQHLSLTRGCPGRCNFCGSPRFWGRRVRAHSADYFVDQLAALASRGTTFFYFSDDTFTLNPERVISVCQKIIQRDLKIVWQAIAKVNAVNAKMLYWMRKAGCVQISYGVESGSEDIRRMLCKDIQLRQIQKAFALTTAHGLMARAYFIYGVPGENAQTIAQTLDIIENIKPLGAIFYMLTLFPGTTLYEAFKTRTGLNDDIWLERREDILSWEYDPDLDREQVVAFGRKLRSAFQQWLPEFARQIELKDDETLRVEQADFLSRLGLTFSHGDYARIQMTPAPVEVALRLFERALTLHPDHRAYWGLALVRQRQGRPTEALEIATRGLVHFPRSEALNICRGVGLIHQGAFDQALDVLLPFSASSEARDHIVCCYQALGRPDKAARYAHR